VPAKGIRGEGGAAYRGDGGNGVWPGAVRTSVPLKVCGVGHRGQCMALGVQRPPTGRPGWRERSLTSGPAPI
jgi:hypothetical protein